MKHILFLTLTAVLLAGCSVPLQEEDEEPKVISVEASDKSRFEGQMECSSYSVHWDVGWDPHASDSSEANLNYLQLERKNPENSLTDSCFVTIGRDSKSAQSPEELAKQFAEKDDSEEYGLTYQNQATGQCQILGYDACYGEYLVYSDTAKKLSKDGYTPSKYRVCYFQSGDGLFQILLVATSEEAFDALLEDANEMIHLTITE